jgi:hypothetical protein
VVEDTESEEGREHKPEDTAERCEVVVAHMVAHLAAAVEVDGSLCATKHEVLGG